MSVLGEEQIEAALADLGGGWAHEGKAIVKEFELKDFVGSVDFVNRITPVAEQMNHHPDLSISWNKVTVSITNHSAGGLTPADFDLAGRIDEVAGGSGD
jgi:4a-hydroxytetrahydrobiopterin dehydratase